MQPLFYFSGMDKMPENNFFQITLSPQAANWLLRVCKITVWTFAMACTLCVLTLVGVGIRLLLFSQTIGDSWTSIFQTVAFPVFEVVFVILSFIQLSHFYKFTRLCRKGIELQQADLFNESFQSLLKNSLTVIVIVVLQLVSTCLFICWELAVYNQQTDVAQ
jgi:hypothetical protein